MLGGDQTIKGIIILFAVSGQEKSGRIVFIYY
jgi:hypothetical protein